MWYMKARWIVKKSNIVDNPRTPSARHTTKCQTGTTQHWIANNKHMLLVLLRVCCPNRFQSNSFHNAHKISRYAQMTSRNAYMTSRFSVPASAGPLLPLSVDNCWLRWEIFYTLLKLVDKERFFGEWKSPSYSHCAAVYYWGSWSEYYDSGVITCSPEAMLTFLGSSSAVRNRELFDNSTSVVILWSEVTVEADCLLVSSRAVRT